MNIDQKTEDFFIKITSLFFFLFWQLTILSISTRIFLFFEGNETNTDLKWFLLIFIFYFQ